MGQGHAARLKVGEHRLNITDEAAARRRIARMANGMGAGQAIDQVWTGEGVADMAHMAFGMKAVAVEAGNAAGLLPAMLQGVEPQSGDGAGVWHVIDPEDPTFETGAVVISFPMFRR